ncbi:MAG: HAD family phosphatase [Lachnospiraceae bacterium]|nr:HAD family phosphatase [Lachnospiraceae bacterium]
MIKNIVFDVGDVLVHFRYRDYMADLGFPKEEIDFLEENMVLTYYWHRLDMGVENEDEAVTHFQELFPQYTDDIALFWEKIEDIVKEFDYAPGLVQSLKDKGYKVYALSNYPDKLSDLHWKHFEFLKLVDGYLISAKEKLAKPDERFYRLLESRFGLDLTECMFVDDREVNVEAAAALGMKAVHFTGEDTLEFLKGLEEV